MRKGFFVKTVSFVLSLLLIIPFFVSCGKESQRDMTDKEIEKYFNVSSIGMSLISAPVKISYEEKQADETVKTVDVIFAFQNAEFNGLSDKYDKPYTSTAVQVKIVIDGNEDSVYYISLFYDGLYFNSDFTNLYVGFDFEKLLAGFGLGTKDTDISDTTVVDDLFFGEVTGSSDYTGNKNEWALKGYEDCFSGERVGKEWHVNVELLTLVDTAMKNNKEAIDPILEFLQPYLPGTDVKDWWNYRLPKMSADFIFDKDGNFVDLKAKVELSGKSHFLNVDFLKTTEECSIKTDFDKSEYIDVLGGVFTPGSLDNLTNNLVNVLTWLQNGNFSFDFDTVSTITGETKYKVAGKVKVETNIYELVMKALAGTTSEENDANTNGNEESIDFSAITDGLQNGLSVNLIVSALDLLKEIVSKADFYLTFDLVKYDENDKPLRKLENFKVKITDGKVSPVDLDGVVVILDEKDELVGKEFLYKSRYEQYNGDLVKSIEAFLMFDFLGGYVRIVSELNSAKLEVTEAGLLKLVLNEGEKEEFFFEITAFDTVAPKE